MSIGELSTAIGALPVVKSDQPKALCAVTDAIGALANSLDGLSETIGACARAIGAPPDVKPASPDVKSDLLESIGALSESIAAPPDVKPAPPDVQGIYRTRLARIRGQLAGWSEPIRDLPIAIVVMPIAHGDAATLNRDVTNSIVELPDVNPECSTTIDASSESNDVSTTSSGADMLRFGPSG